MYYLWDTFSVWHIVGCSILLTSTAICFYILKKAASPKYAPLEKGGALISGGRDWRGVLR